MRLRPVGAARMARAGVDAEAPRRDEPLAATVGLRRSCRPCSLRKQRSEPRRHRAASSSRASEVICTSGRPQATTQENGSRSFSTLTAKPCVVTPRETCTPIEAILRSAPTRRCSRCPRSQRERAAMPSLGERGDDRGFHRAQVAADVVDRHDRVADELAGAVVGELAAAVGVDHVDAFGAVEVLAERQLLGARRAGRACRRAGARAAAACRAARRPAGAREASPGWRPPSE